jgi:hypothetical protein
MICTECNYKLFALVKIQGKWCCPICKKDQEHQNPWIEVPNVIPPLTELRTAAK